MGELVPQSPLDLPGKQRPIVAEVAFERVPVDDDPVLVAFPRETVAEVMAVGPGLGAAVGDDHGDRLEHCLEFLRQRVDRVGYERRELIQLFISGHR